MAKELEIIINTDGTINIDAMGYQGNQCEEVLNSIVEQMNGEVTDSNFKSEYWDQSIEVDQNINRQ